jgi:hypothetical protein
MNKLYNLISQCKCGVYISVNPHRDQYQSVIDWFNDNVFYCDGDAKTEITEDVMHGMIVENTIIKIQFYPDTPIGFYRVFHYDLEIAIDAALACLDDK